MLRKLLTLCDAAFNRKIALVATMLADLAPATTYGLSLPTS
jgi:hypothetical protein